MEYTKENFDRLVADKAQLIFDFNDLSNQLHELVREKVELESKAEKFERLAKDYEEQKRRADRYAFALADLVAPKQD